jgi:glycosyltransferase involved in cell wall biosynthesis
MFGWEFPPHNSGGLGVACQGLTRAMAARGIEIVFVMPKKIDVAAPWARFVFADSGVEARAVNSSLKPYVTGNGYARALHDAAIYGVSLLQEVRRYALLGGQIAQEERFDVIYAHDWLSFGAGVEAKRVSGKPLIVHVHATEFDRCGGPMGINEEVYEIEKEGMRAADRIIAVSQFTKDLIMREYGVPESKIKVVHNGIDELGESQGPNRLRLAALKASGYSIVLFLGRVTLQKGPDYFLRAARSVLEREPRTVFFMSGSGDMERQIMDMAAQFGISDRVLFTGFLRGHDRTEVYKAADLFVMPSVSEPFGITALEAMKSGTPVLLSKQSGAAEAVKHALKVDFWDVDEMTNKIAAVLRHKGLRQTLSEHGKHEASRLTWEDAAGKVENVLQETLLAGVQ